jgi:hypothetical protein
MARALLATAAAALFSHASSAEASSARIEAAVLEPNAYWSAGPRIARVPPGAPPPSLLAAGRAGGPELERVMCVVDGRAVISATPVAAGAKDLRGAGVAEPPQWRCDLSFLSFGGLHWAAAYGVPHGNGGGGRGGGARPELLGAPLLLTRDEEAAPVEQRLAQLAAHRAALAAATPAGTAALGVYYTTYLNPLAQLYQNISRDFGWLRTTETVLRNASLRLADSVWRYGAAAAAPAWRNYSQTCDLLHQEPALGVYCLYRRRANESAAEAPMPDCPEASRVLQAHAAEISAAGFDFVAPDATNWDGDPRLPPGGGPPGADFYQLRPAEVIAEEWAAARLAGRATPQLSVFAMVNEGGALWRWYLSELFNNATLLDLDMVFRDRATGRKVFIAADLGNKTDVDALAEIADNGGLNDTVVPLMWFAPNASGAWEASGRLAYFSRCIAAHEESGELDFSTDAWLDPAVDCGHLKTRASPVGPSWTVSTGLSLNSLPFGAVRFNGLLTKKQWWDVLADPEPTALIFAPSWNEFGSRAYSLPALVGANNTAFFAVGAEPDDPDRFVLFEDGYGAQRSRTIEPSVEDGGRFFETFASCVRVYRLQAALGIVSDGAGCDVAGEECCTVRDDERFVHAWSLDLPGAGGAGAADSLLTADKAERDALLAAGWAQVCVPTIFGRGPTAACVDPNLPFEGAAGADAASRGPLALLSNASGAVAGVVPLVRCLELASGLHFVANSSACGAGARAETVLGFGGAGRSSLFARAVHRCRAARRWYSTVNVPCLPGDVDDGVLLYAV